MEADVNWIEKERILKSRRFCIQKISRDNETVISDWGVYTGECLNMIDDEYARDEMFDMKIGEAKVYPLHNWPGEDCVWIRLRRFPNHTPLPIYPNFLQSVVEWLFHSPVKFF